MQINSTARVYDSRRDQPAYVKAKACTTAYLAAMGDRQISKAREIVNKLKHIPPARLAPMQLGELEAAQALITQQGVG